MQSKPLRPETEAEFATWVVAVAQTLGWRVAHFRAAQTVKGWRTPVQADGAGFPDLVLAHPQKGRPLIVAELKSEKGKLSPEQEEWLRDLAVCPHVWACVWRPSDRDKIQGILAQEV